MFGYKRLQAKSYDPV